MNRAQIPILVLRGSPAERGRQQGAALQTLIAASISKLRKGLHEQQWQRGRALSSLCLGQLAGSAPHLLAELEGIASSTGTHVQDILLLSAFEFLGERTHGCTSAGLALATGSVVAQNWDAPEGGDQTLVALIHEGDGERLLTIASAGSLGWVGINGHGLALVNNDLILDSSFEGMPSLVIRRLMLGQPSVDGALSILRSYKHLSGRSFTLGDGRGCLRLAEVGPSAGVTDRAVRSVVHTNHPVYPKPAMWEDVEAVARIYPSSRSRLRTARSCSLSSVEDVTSLLRNRDNAPDAISKSPSKREPTETAFSVVFDCGRREALVALGRPDHSAFHKISVSQSVSA
jgi:isopenicillin-N N-acyltransferase-like protein